MSGFYYPRLESTKASAGPGLWDRYAEGLRGCGTLNLSSAWPKALRCHTACDHAPVVSSEETRLERDSKRERETHTEAETDRQTNRQRNAEKPKDRETEEDKDKEKQCGVLVN